VPAGVVDDVIRESVVEVFDVVAGFGAKLAVTPAGKVLVTENVIGAVCPDWRVMVTACVPIWLAVTDMVDAVDIEKSGATTRVIGVV